MKVVYKGDCCFRVFCEEGEVLDFSYQAGTVEDAKEMFLRIMGNMFDAAVCVGLMEKEVNDSYNALPRVDIMRGVKGLNC